MTHGKIKCATYARVSTDHQGDSVENQISQCQEYISRLGGRYDATDIRVYIDEAVSGYYTSVFERAEMKKAIQDAKNKKYEVLIFKEISRLGRDKQENPAIIGMFEQYGVRVIAINDNYDSLNKDNITFDILSVLSEQESKKISARVSTARKQKAKRGQWSGEAPIGYTVDRETKKLVLDPAYKEIPRLIFECYVFKGLGTFKVAQYLNKRGLKSKNGHLWSRETVNKILKNEVYIGNVVYGTRRNELLRQYDDQGKMTKKKVQVYIDKKDWQVVEQAHEALIDRKTFYAAQRILSSRSHRHSPRRAYHPLTGILTCGKCRQNMVCQKRTQNNRCYRYYICKTYHKFGRDACSQANVNAHILEADILAKIRGKLNQVPDDLFSLTLNKDKDRQHLKLELIHHDKKKKKLQRDLVDLFDQRELFDQETYQDEMVKIKRLINSMDEEREVLSKKIEAIRHHVTSFSLGEHFVHSFMQLNHLDNGQLRRIFHELIKQVILTDTHVHTEYYVDFTRWD